MNWIKINEKQPLPITSIQLFMEVDEQDFIKLKMDHQVTLDSWMPHSVDVSSGTVMCKVKGLRSDWVLISLVSHSVIMGAKVITKNGSAIWQDIEGVQIPTEQIQAWMPLPEPYQEEYKVNNYEED